MAQNFGIKTIYPYPAMRIEEKIIHTLLEVEDKLQKVKPEWYIIGSSAMILSGIKIAETSDIDILTTTQGADEFQEHMQKYMEINPSTKENDLFRSNFARFNLPLMDIEVMGGLQVMKNNIWHDVHINHFHEMHIGNLTVKIPTLEEQKRLLLPFGRDKDLRRMKLFDERNQ